MITQQLHYDAERELWENRKTMEACQPLREYAWLVDTVRRFRKETQNLESAVDRAIDEMPEDYVIRSFLVVNRAEVKNVFPDIAQKLKRFLIHANYRTEEIIW